MPRSNKTAGRQARDITRAQASRARSGSRGALRDGIHVSRRSKAWRDAADLSGARRLLDARLLQKEGRAGAGQRKRVHGPRQAANASSTAKPALPAKPKKARGPQRWPGPGDLPAYGPMLGAGKTGQARSHVQRGK